MHSYELRKWSDNLVRLHSTVVTFTRIIIPSYRHLRLLFQTSHRRERENEGYNIQTYIRQPPIILSTTLCERKIERERESCFQLFSSWLQYGNFLGKRHDSLDFQSHWGSGAYLMIMRKRLMADDHTHTPLSLSSQQVDMHGRYCFSNTRSLTHTYILNQFSIPWNAVV